MSVGYGLLPAKQPTTLIFNHETFGATSRRRFKYHREK